MRDPTFWILARASGLTAYVLLTMSVLAGLVLKSRPFGRALSAAAVTDTHRFLALLGLGAVALHGLTLVLDSTVHISLAGAPRAGPRALPAALDGARRPGRGPDGSDHRLVPAAQAHRHARLAPAALGDVRSFRARHGPRPGGRHRHPDAVGVRASTSAPSARSSSRPRGARSTVRFDQRRPKEETMYRIQIDRSLCSGFGACAELAPDVIELDASGNATARVGVSDDPAVLDAAAACPMAAITIIEEEAA